MAKIDLTKAYHSIPLAEDQRRIYAFTDYQGNYYAYRTMPMGAAFAPTHIHNTMEAFLNNLPDNNRTHVRHYQDDIILAALTKASLHQLIGQVTKLVEDAGLRIKKENSTYDYSLTILGYDSLMIRMAFRLKNMPRS